MKFEKFRKALCDTQNWPSKYNFRFIVPFTELKELERILGNVGISTRFSKNENYVTVIFTRLMNSPEEVIEVYRRVSDLKGIISL